VHPLIRRALREAAPTAPPELTSRKEILPMACRQHSDVRLAAIAAIFAALAIGSLPVAALVALGSHMESVK